MRKDLTIILFLTLISFALKGQQVPLYNQYMFNGFLLNPAFAGSEGYTVYSLSAREQWIGFKDSPKTYALSGQTRLMRRRFNIVRNPDGTTRYKRGRSGNVGLGGYAFNDRNGLIDRTGLQFTYAYHISIGTSQLSFGLSAMAYQFKINWDKREGGQSIFRDGSDPLAGSLNNVLYIPDANFGTYYTSEPFFAGFSVTQLFESMIKFGGNGSELYSNYRMKRHYNVLLGTVRELKRSELELEPSVLMKGTEDLFMQFDINLRLIYDEKYWGGISYRTNNALIALAGVQAGKIYFGYAFDYAFNRINMQSFGSHELVISVKLGDPAKRYRWIRRY
jgi:type IX secretion system PorP/SprF family membrane protein